MLLASAVHWIPRYPPQIDLAQHAGQLRLLHDIWFIPAAADHDLWRLNWFTPYIPAYVAGAMLSALMPAVVVAKLLWTISVLAMVYTAVRIRALMEGLPELDWLLLPGLYGATYQWGFLTFLFAIAPGLYLVERWVLHLRDPTRISGTLLAGAFSLLFFAHSLVTAWVLCVCLIMLLSTFSTTHRGVAKQACLALPLLVPLVPAFAWVRSTQSAAQTQGATIWSWDSRYLDFFPQWLGISDRMLAAAAAATLLGLLYASRTRLSGDSLRQAPLVVTIYVLLFVPNTLYGNAQTYTRFFTLLGPSLLWALTRSANERRSTPALRIALPLACGAFVMLATVRLVRFATEQQDFVRLLSYMEPGHRTLSMMSDRQSDAMENRRTYLHFPLWYQVETGGIVEPNFADYVPMIVRFRKADGASVAINFEASPAFADVKRLDRFHYIVSRPLQAVADGPTPRTFTQVAQEGRWILYARTAPPPP